MTVVDFRLAVPDELPLVMDIVAEAAAWLTAKGIDQWPSPPNVHWERRMAIRDDMHGQEIGKALLEWTTSETRQQGKSHLRLSTFKEVMRGSPKALTSFAPATQ